MDARMRESLRSNFCCDSAIHLCVYFRLFFYCVRDAWAMGLKPPQRHEVWNETRDAFAFGSECVQPMIVNDEWKGNEDCLFLNVHVPACMRILLMFDRNLFEARLKRNFVSFVRSCLDRCAATDCVLHSYGSVLFRIGQYFRAGFLRGERHHCGLC